MKKSCTGFTLKMIAVITMFIDHFGATIWERMMLQEALLGARISGDTMYDIYMVLRCIGRMAFPIYCFLLVEGLTHTRNCRKYLSRLLVFAAVSEIPFDLAFNHTILNFTYNNVFFTLFLGLLTIWLADEIKRRFMNTPKQVFIYPVFVLLALFGCAMADFVFCCDYGASGIVAIWLIYIFKSKPMVGFACSVLSLALLSDISEICALLMLVPVYCYNGQRGTQVKYLFYLFYPVHLLLLSLACLGLGLS